jgi:phosphoribosyl 1,2-cyclic phosphodiesterase
MIAISLQSGSNGNCLYVETRGVKLLFDAGIRCLEAQKRLALYGRDISDVNALIISHDHGDHVRHAGVYQRRHGIPLYITPKTLERAEKNHRFGKLKDINYFYSGGTITFGDVTVHTIPSPHDGADGSLFVVTSGGKRLGIFIDLGHVFQELYSVISSLDAVFLESNYDHHMLIRGPYPDFLKQRIQGLRGHLSNRDAAELLQAGKHLQWACLAHLSKNNNTPQRALQTHREIVGDCLTLYTASRHEPTGILNVSLSDERP